MNALAALYVLEIYLVKYIGDTRGEIDVPNDVSKLFEMVNFSTRINVTDRDMYNIPSDDITALFNHN